MISNSTPLQKLCDRIERVPRLDEGTVQVNMDPAVQRNGKPAVEPTIKPVVEANADPSVKANVDAAAAEGHAQATPVGFESGEIPK